MDKQLRIMVVDDEKIIRESFTHWFENAGHWVTTAASGSEALEKLEKTIVDVMFADIKMPKMTGMELLKIVREEYPDTTVVIITAFGTIQTAIDALKMGAADYLLKPFKPEHLDLVLEKSIQQIKLVLERDQLKNRLDRISRFENIIGQSPEMENIFRLIMEIAETDASVLIQGETGTGKELIAKAIHSKSRRKDNPFVAINCGAMVESLLETELFGHRKGAFTGATHTRKGFFEIVSGGTLFLDEIGEISAKMQVDLLRVLEEKKVTRVGDAYPIEVDFRLISATRQNLEKRIAESGFREDFFYRINVVGMRIPPLRERKEDIPLLVDHFLHKYSRETNKEVDRVSNDALDVLLRHDWPGNIRELENAVERAVVLSQAHILKAEDFYFIRSSKTTLAVNRSLRENEIAHILDVLIEKNWNITHAAEVLEINRVTLHKKIKRYGLEKREG